MTQPSPTRRPSVAQVQRKARALAKDLDTEADALDVESHTPRPPMMKTGPNGQEPDWHATAMRNSDLRAKATERRELAERIRAAAKG